MRVAFLMLNHRGPAQLVRLLTTLRSQLPDSPIVVHHDVFHGDLPGGLLEPIGNVHLLTTGKRVTWGDFSLVEVCRQSLTWMREHLEFDWIVLLSAQDYPVRPLAGLAADLTSDGADALFGATPVSQMPLANRVIMRRRYLFRYRPATVSWPGWLPGGARAGLRRGARVTIRVLNNLQPLFKIYRLTEDAPYRLGWRARRTPFGPGWPCWHASMWFAMSRGALERVLDYMSDHPEYVNYYRDTLIPDESIFATLAFNSPNLRVANRDVTYTRWANSMASHPDIFEKADFGELATVPQYFARKFDIDRDAEILDALDKLIGQGANRESRVES